MAVNTYNKTSKAKVSDSFKVNEFSCKGKGCCSKTLIDSKLVTYLQKIRNHFNASITINSAYRCSIHNKKVGGASSSRHTMGQAADIVVDGVKPAEVAKYAESIGVLGIGLYETNKDGYFVHIDTRTTKSFWYGQAQKKCDTFGGSKPKENKPKLNKNILVWQKAAIADGFKLTADGIWDKECITVAKKAICQKRTIGYKNKNLTKIVQKAIGVSADGKFGNSTKKAVIAWQKRMGLTADGIVGYNSWKKILDI